MAKLDIRSNLLPQLAFDAAISTDTTTAGFIIDTKDFDNGFMFTFAASAWTDGTYVPLLEEGDAANLSDAAAVPDANLIGTEAGATLTAATVDGAVLGSIGAFGTKRYLRLSFVSTSTATGATIQAFSLGKTELRADPRLSA